MSQELLSWAIRSTSSLVAPSSSQANSSVLGARIQREEDELSRQAVRSLQAAERCRRKCLEQWEVLQALHQRCAVKLQIVLTKFQGMAETFETLVQDHLMKLIVLESSAVANQQYDIQMLFKVSKSFVLTLISL